MLRDRVVLIGNAAASLRDLFEVPHTRFNRGESLFTISGVEVHANRLATLMDERNGSFQRGWLMPGWGNLLLVIGFAGTGLLLGERIPKQRISILVVGLVAGGAAAGLGALLWNHIWIGMAMPLTGLLSFSGSRLAAPWGGKPATLTTDSTTARPDHLTSGGTTTVGAKDSLLSDGRFQGQQLPITTLFTDTASFTSVSEGMSPRELMDWLNRGMEICVPAVTERDGMVNKFTGDGMLAVFGVPLWRSIGRSQGSH